MKQNGEHAQGEIKRKGLEMAVLGEKSVVNQAKGENLSFVGGKRREKKYGSVPSCSGDAEAAD